MRLCLDFAKQRKRMKMRRRKKRKRMAWILEGK